MVNSIGDKPKNYTKRDYMADLKKVCVRVDKPKSSPKPTKT
jgi:hypothetical protein